MVRIEPLDRLDDLRFRGAIDVGDEVVASLGFDLQAFQARNSPDDHFAGAAGGFDRKVE